MLSLVLRATFIPSLSNDNHQTSKTGPKQEVRIFFQIKKEKHKKLWQMQIVKVEVIQMNVL